MFFKSLASADLQDYCVILNVGNDAKANPMRLCKPRYFLDPWLLRSDGLQDYCVILSVGNDAKANPLRLCKPRYFLFSKTLRAGSAFFPNKKSLLFSQQGFALSGWQDSNLRPPGPKPGAMTGLRYTPKASANI